MKLAIQAIVILPLLFVLGCKSTTAFNDPFIRPQIGWTPNLVLTVQDGERILGNKSRLEKTTAYLDEGTKVYQSAFRDDWVDPETGKTGILYYMLEEFDSIEAARSVLDGILQANGLNPAHGTRMKNGAELHYLAGGKITRMVLILRENRLIRLKVNQLTSRYSLEEFRKVAGELASRL